MNKEFFEALDALEKEKGIPKDYLLEKIEAALVSAYKKEYGNNTNVRVVLDAEKKEVKLYQQIEVVEVVENPETQISLEDAKAIAKKYKIGSFIETELKTKNFRRLSAAAAKSVIIQGIREGERKLQQDAYSTRHGDIITVTVDKVDDESGNVLVQTDTGRAVLRVAEQIPGEQFYVGDKIKVLVSEVNREEKGPIVTLSRSNPGFLRRMMELEIPEIADGVVEIVNVVREPGFRSKVSVVSHDSDVDPVGACIGQHSSRINTVLDELSGEKIDLIPYSEDLRQYIASSLSPAEVTDVILLDEHTARAIVPDKCLSLAIGREGQNARLAAKLVGCKIDIKPESYEESETDAQV